MHSKCTSTYDYEDNMFMSFKNCKGNYKNEFSLLCPPVAFEYLQTYNKYTNLISLFFLVINRCYWMCTYACGNEGWG